MFQIGWYLWRKLSLVSHLNMNTSTLAKLYFFTLFNTFLSSYYIFTLFVAYFLIMSLIRGISFHILFLLFLISINCFKCETCCFKWTSVYFFFFECIVLTIFPFSSIINYYFSYKYALLYKINRYNILIHIMYEWGVNFFLITNNTKLYFYFYFFFIFVFLISLLFFHHLLFS